MEQKAIPIGVEFYKDIVDKPYYYIDKTLLVKELIDNCSKVTLFTRPRRFGKTRESGEGRPDIVLEYPSSQGPVVILKLKVVKRYQDMKTGCDTAIHQLEKRDYAAHWRNEGYTDIIQYGICFYKKECMIKICK